MENYGKMEEGTNEDGNRGKPSLGLRHGMRWHQAGARQDCYEKERLQ
jgi:hypothetical protein